MPVIPAVVASGDISPDRHLCPSLLLATGFSSEVFLHVCQRVMGLPWLE
jgi:hypothetical protein